MSLNKYNATTGELENIASGQRTWVGTKAAYDAAKSAGNLPTNALICITDDEDDTITDAVTDGDSRAVTSNAVFDAIKQTAHTLYGTIEPNTSVTIYLDIAHAPYILGVSGSNGGTHGVWVGIGYGETATRHTITKIVNGANSSVFTVVPVTSNGYGFKITSTYSQTAIYSVMSMATFTRGE